MRLPKTGIGPTLEHADASIGKTGPEKAAFRTGLVAPGEAVPFAFALSVCAGAGGYLTLSFEPGWGMVSGALACVAGLVYSLLRGWYVTWVRIAAILLCGALIGFVAGKVRTHLVAQPSLSSMQGPVIVEGWVSAVESAQTGVRLRIIPHAIAGLSRADMPQTIRLTHRLSLNVSPGRFVRCWAVLRPPPGASVPGDYDFQRQAWFQGLGAVGYVQGRCRGGVLGEPEHWASALHLKIAAIRRQLAVFTKTASGERAGGFAAALISGDRSFMAAEDQETLRASGLAHLLAISGLHLGIVGGLVYFLFRQGLAFIAPLSLRIPVQKPAALAALVAIAIYLVISGASVSTQRAFIMSAVFFGAILIDRPALSLRSFSIAMIAVVLVAPESVFAPGFQMSFAATGVLIAIYEAWSRRRAGTVYGFFGRGIFAAKSLAVTSIAASLATAPFAIFHFERLAPLGLLANLAAMPVVSLFSVPAAGLSIILAPFGLSEYGLILFGWSLESVLAIAGWTETAGENWDYALKIMPESALLLFVSTLVGLVLFRKWLRVGVVLASVICGFATWSLLPVAGLYWASSGELYINTNGNQYERIAFVDADALGPLRFRSAQRGELCEQSVCHFETAAGERVLIQKTEDTTQGCMREAGIILSAKSREGETIRCPNTLYWEDIKRNGGAQIRLRNGQFVLRHAKLCSRRPWRTCPSLKYAGPPKRSGE